jgi:anti-anti-sigma factor
MTGSERARPVEKRIASVTVVATPSGDELVVDLIGSIDATHHGALYRMLEELLSTDAPSRVVIDLSDVDFCDCAGARVLVAAHRLAKAHGAVCQLRFPQPHLVWLLQLTGVASELDICSPPPVVDRALRGE